MQRKALPPSTKVSWATECDAASTLGNSAGVTQLRSTKHVCDFGWRAPDALVGARGEAGVLEVHERSPTASETRGRRPAAAGPGERSPPRTRCWSRTPRAGSRVEGVGAVRLAGGGEDEGPAARRADEDRAGGGGAPRRPGTRTRPSTSRRPSADRSSSPPRRPATRRPRGPRAGSRSRRGREEPARCRRAPPEPCGAGSRPVVAGRERRPLGRGQRERASCRAAAGSGRAGITTSEAAGRRAASPGNTAGPVSTTGADAASRKTQSLESRDRHPLASISPAATRPGGARGP